MYVIMTQSIYTNCAFTCEEKCFVKIYLIIGAEADQPVMYAPNSLDLNPVD